MSGSKTTVAADVTVVLGEWIVEPTPTSAAAGELTFTAYNRGGLDHEMVVARADAPGGSPTDAGGAVDEEQIPQEGLIGEIEKFPTGEQPTVTFDMDPGSSVLFCNVNEPEDGGEVLSHFAEGMGHDVHDGLIGGRPTIGAGPCGPASGVRARGPWQRYVSAFGAPRDRGPEEERHGTGDA